MPVAELYRISYFALLTLFVLGMSKKSRAQCVVLPNAFAHNDYWHKRPLLDALDNGFTHVEADIYLQKGKLIVTHLLHPVFYNRKRTLERLYFQPIQERIAANGGFVFPGDDRSLILMIDIKTNSRKTYQTLLPLLEKYRSILTEYKEGRIIQRPVTVVITGRKPYYLRKEKDRLAFIDEDLRQIAADTSVNEVFPIASCRYTRLLAWDGTGSIPVSDRRKLCSFVQFAHGQGKKVRLWASPEKESVWKELLDCGVDLINTDKLEKLKNFLLSRKTETAGLLP
jgi:hypothetical protein